MPFTLPLEDYDHASISEDVFSLRFNLPLWTMYVEQEMYFVDGDILEVTLLQKNKSENGHLWIFGSRII